MTWVDIAFVLVVLVFIALGARLGSLWTGACILGGLFGAALVDIYSLPVAGLMGSFPASTLLAAVLLYVGGVAAILIPGAVISRIGSVFILHLIDGAFGLLTGAFTAVILISLFLMMAVPLVPRFESSKAFRKSVIVRPFHRILEDVFSQKPFSSVYTRNQIQVEAFEKLVPLAKGAGDEIKKLIR